MPLNAMLASSEKRVDASLSNMQALSGKRLASVGQNMSRLGSQWTRTVSLPIIGAGAVMIKTASDFESALTQVQTQAHASGREIEYMRTAILKLAPAVGQTPTQLANALFHVESSGLRGAKALDVLTQSAKLAAIGHSDLEQTTNAVVAVMKSAPKDIKNATDAIGVMNATVGAGNMRMQDLVGALSTGIVPSAKAAGLGLRDVGAALDVMTSRGIPAEAAATRLRMTISLMEAPGGAAAKALKAVGISQGELAADMRKPDGLVIAVDDLKHKMDAAGLSATQQTQLITRAFGSRSSSAILTLLQNTKDLQKSFTEIGKNSGAKKIGQEFDQTTHDMAFKMDQLKAKAETEMVEVGTKVGPEVLKVAGQVADDAGKIADAFSSLPKPAQDAIITGGLMAAALGPSLRLMGVFTTGVGRLWDAAKIAEQLATGNRTLFSVSKTASGVAGGQVGSMEVGTLIARNMVGGGGGLASSSEKGSLGTAAVATSAEEEASGGLSAAGVLSRVVGVAGVAAFAAPVAIVAYEALKKLLGSDSYGTTISKQVFSRGFGGAQAPSLSKQVADALDALHRDTTVQRPGQARPVAGRAGGVAYSTTVDAHLRVDQLSPAQQAKAAADARRAGTLIAKQLEAGWGQYKTQSEPIMFSQLRGELKKLPPSAQAAAVLSAVKFAEGLEKQGRLTKGSAAKFLSDIERQFPRFEKYLGLAAGDGIRAFNRAFDFSKTEQNVRGQLHKISQDFPQVQKAVSDTAGTVQDKAAAAVKALKQIQSNGTGLTKRLATQDLKELRDTTSKDMTAMAGIVVSKTGQMSGAIKQGSSSAAKVAAENMADFSSHVQDAMANGTLSTGQGMNLIISTLNKALKEMGQKQMSPIQVAAFTLTGGKSGGKTSQLLHRGGSAAGGGIFPIGRPGTPGRDTIPLNVGGQDIVVGEGEVPVVFNRHQWPEVNSRFADMGGLPGYFQKRRRPNYMGTGGVVPRRGFSSGGIESYGQLEGLWDQAGGAKNMAALMAAIAEAESGGNPRAHNASGASGLWQILGVPFPGNVWDPLTNARMALAKYRSQGLGAWTTYTSGAYRSYLHGNVPPSAGGAGADINIAAPAVHGSGPIADITRAAVAIAAKAAGKYAQSHEPSGGPSAGAQAVGPAGGGFSPGQLGSYDGLEVAKWIIPELQWARKHGWAGRVTSGYRPPSEVVHGEFATAPQGQSEHRLDIYPGGAVDVSDYQQFASTIRGYSGREKLIELGIDPLHFSGTGHSRGGLIRQLASGGLTNLGSWGRESTSDLRNQKTAMALMHKVWNVARRYYPGASGFPPTTMASSSQPFVGDVYDPNHPAVKNRQILWPDWMTRMLLGLPGAADPTGGTGARNSGLETLIHEWAHQFQAPNLIANGKIWQVEGGAQSFAREFAPRIASAAGIQGFKLEAPGQDTYYSYVQQVRKQLGEDWIRKGQFTDKARKYGLGGMVRGFAPGGIAAARRPARRSMMDSLGNRPRYPRIAPLSTAIPAISSAMSELNSILDPNTGQVAVLQDRDQALQNIFGTTPFGAISSAADAVVTPADGSAPYVDQSLVKGREDQLTQLYKLEVKAEEELQIAVSIITPLLKRLATAIVARQKRIAAIKERIRQNLQKIKQLAKLIAEERRHRYTGAAKRASDNRISAWNGQITGLKDQNATLGGDRDKIGTGGELGTLSGQVKSLQGTIGTVTQDRLDIQGPSGIGGSLGDAKVTVASRQNDLAALSPSSLTAAIAAAGSGSGATADQQAMIDALQQQLQTSDLENAVLTAQYGVLRDARSGSLPPFGGSFLTGGVIPGPVGAARTVIAHGGEVVQPVGADVNSNVKVLMEDQRTRVWVNDVEQQVEKVTRRMARNAGRRLPGAGGGRRF